MKLLVGILLAFACSAYGGDSDALRMGERIMNEINTYRIKWANAYLQGQLSRGDADGFIVDSGTVDADASLEGDIILFPRVKYLDNNGESVESMVFAFCEKRNEFYFGVRVLGHFRLGQDISSALVFLANRINVSHEDYSPAYGIINSALLGIFAGGTYVAKTKGHRVFKRVGQSGVALSISLFLGAFAGNKLQVNETEKLYRLIGEGTSNKEVSVVERAHTLESVLSEAMNGVYGNQVSDVFF